MLTNKEIELMAQKEWDHWADHLGLQNWCPLIRITKDVPSGMSVAWEQGYKKVALDIKSWSKEHDVEFTPDIFSRNILHELLHCAQFRLVEFGKEEMGCDPSKSILWLMWRPAIEDANDTVTSIIWRMHQLIGCDK